MLQTRPCNPAMSSSQPRPQRQKRLLACRHALADCKLLLLLLLVPILVLLRPCSQARCSPGHRLLTPLTQRGSRVWLQHQRLRCLGRPCRNVVPLVREPTCELGVLDGSMGRSQSLSWHTACQQSTLRS